MICRNWQVSAVYVQLSHPCEDQTIFLRNSKGSRIWSTCYHHYSQLIIFISKEFYVFKYGSFHIINLFLFLFLFFFVSSYVFFSPMFLIWVSKYKLVTILHIFIASKTNNKMQHITRRRRQQPNVGPVSGGHTALPLARCNTYQTTKIPYCV